MKKQIASLAEFNEERRRARRRIEELEILIENDVHQLKESLHPVKVAGDVLKSFLAPEKEGFLANTIGNAIDALLGRIFFRKSKSLLKFLVVLLLRNFARNLVSKNRDNIVEWVKKMLAKISSNHEGDKEQAAV